MKIPRIPPSVIISVKDIFEHIFFFLSTIILTVPSFLPFFPFLPPSLLFPSPHLCPFFSPSFQPPWHSFKKQKGTVKSKPLLYPCSLTLPCWKQALPQFYRSFKKKKKDTYISSHVGIMSPFPPNGAYPLFTFLFELRMFLGVHS